MRASHRYRAVGRESWLPPLPSCGYHYVRPNCAFPWETGATLPLQSKRTTEQDICASSVSRLWTPYCALNIVYLLPLKALAQVCSHCICTGLVGPPRIRNHPVMPLCRQLRTIVVQRVQDSTGLSQLWYCCCDQTITQLVCHTTRK